MLQDLIPEKNPCQKFHMNTVRNVASLENCLLFIYIFIYWIKLYSYPFSIV